MILKIILFILICIIIYSVYNYIRIGKFFWIKKQFLKNFNVYLPNILWEPVEQYYLNKYLIYIYIA